MDRAHNSQRFVPLCLQQTIKSEGSFNNKIFIRFKTSLISNHSISHSLLAEISLGHQEEPCHRVWGSSRRLLSSKTSAVSFCNVYWSTTDISAVISRHDVGVFIGRKQLQWSNSSWIVFYSYYTLKILLIWGIFVHQTFIIRYQYRIWPRFYAKKSRKCHFLALYLLSICFLKCSIRLSNVEKTHPEQSLTSSTWHFELFRIDFSWASNKSGFKTCSAFTNLCLLLKT